MKIDVVYAMQCASSSTLRYRPLFFLPRFLYPPIGRCRYTSYPFPFDLISVNTCGDPGANREARQVLRRGLKFAGIFRRRAAIIRETIILRLNLLCPL